MKSIEEKSPLGMDMPSKKEKNVKRTHDRKN